jgi:tRNA uridine 5-carboxymethylaminomethyl modification enzyme
MSRPRVDHRYDVVVVGAGHAGAGVALAAARAGCPTLLPSPTLHGLESLPGNHSIGRATPIVGVPPRVTAALLVRETRDGAAVP